MINIINKSEYIGKRLTWDRAVELFPYKWVAFKDCKMSGIDMENGILVDVIEDEQIETYIVEHLKDKYYIDRTLDGFAGGYIHGVIIENNI